MEYKVCSKCGESKNSGDFHKHSGSKDGLQSVCKTCKSGIAKSDREANPEKYKARRKVDSEKYAEYHKEYRVLNKDRIQKQTREWQEKNPERYRAALRTHYYKHHEKLKAASRAWNKANRSTRRASSARRLASKRRATVVWSDNYKVKIIYAKAHRLSQWLGQKFEVDHIVPLQSSFVCGLHNEHNMQILLKLDNIVKGNRWWPDMSEVTEELNSLIGLNPASGEGGVNPDALQ